MQGEALAMRQQSYCGRHHIVHGPRSSKAARDGGSVDPATEGVSRSS